MVLWPGVCLTGVQGQLRQHGVVGKLALQRQRAAGRLTGARECPPAITSAPPADREQADPPRAIHHNLSVIHADVYDT